MYQPTIDATALALLAPPKPIGGSHVIVLAHGQPGTQRIGTLLSGQPSLACTAGTGVLQLCEQAASTWRGAQRTGSSLSMLAASSVRALTGSLISVITSQEGKQRWCEVSTASARSARTFLEIYPQTKIICLHRNCADVLHASVPDGPMHEGRLPVGHGPGGSGGSGRHSGSGGSGGHRGRGGRGRVADRGEPGDPTAEVASCWQERTESLLALERDHAAQCLRVRYEDLVASPATMAGILSFLGLDRRPDLDWPGPAESGPEARHQDAALLAARIGSPLLEQINRLHAELHYPAIERAPAWY
jgi:hypothetical protein